MKHAKLLVIGFCSSLVALSVVADDSGNTALENGAGAAGGKQTPENVGTMPNGADGGAPKAATTTGKAAPNRRGAGTGTLFRYIYEQDKKGNIKIEGLTDTSPPP